MIKYRAFIKTVELGSITKAAEFLGYSQPGLSHILNSLEQKVGFPLLIRSKTAVEPTEDGKKLLPYCYKIVEAENEFISVSDSINGVMTGTIRIGAPNSVLVNTIPEIINKFHALYPDVEIFVQEDTLADTRKNIQNGQIDIGFITEEIADDLVFHPLFYDKICLAMHAKHEFASYEKIPAAKLENHDLIMPMSGWDDIANIVLKGTTAQPQIKHYSASDAASFAMVANQIGTYIISSLQVPSLPASVTVREFEEDFHRVIGVAIKNNKSATPAQKEFIKIAKDIFK